MVLKTNWSLSSDLDLEVLIRQRLKDGRMVRVALDSRGSNSPVLTIVSEDMVSAAMIQVRDWCERTKEGGGIKIVIEQI